jgi:hypothetical protein
VLLTVIVAVRVPSEVGLNTTENLHVAVAAIELHVFDTINSPLSLDTPRTSTDCPPTLISATLVGALVVPLTCDANVTGFGEIAS